MEKSCLEVVKRSPMNGRSPRNSLQTERVTKFLYPKSLLWMAKHFYGGKMSWNSVTNWRHFTHIGRLLEWDYVTCSKDEKKSPKHILKSQNMPNLLYELKSLQMFQRNIEEILHAKLYQCSFKERTHPNLVINWRPT